MLAIVPLFIGTTELMLIAGIALLLFGGKKLPEMMRGLGQGVREFKKGTQDITEPINDVKEEVKETIDDSIKSVASKDKDDRTER